MHQGRPFARGVTKYLITWCVRLTLSCTNTSKIWSFCLNWACSNGCECFSAGSSRWGQHLQFGITSLQTLTINLFSRGSTRRSFWGKSSFTSKMITWWASKTSSSIWTTLHSPCFRMWEMTFSKESNSSNACRSSWWMTWWNGPTPW